MNRLQHPAPTVPYTGYSPIYFGEEWRVRSPYDPIGYDDRGALKLSRGRVTFTGARVLVDCENVVAITMVRGAVPWPLAPGALLVLTAVAYLTGNFAGLPLFHPLTVAAMLLFAVGLVAVNWKRWVQVEYLDAAGVARRAYFRREATFIPSPRGTQRLYNEMKSKILEAD
jgi:hypothetical protein